MKLGIAGSNVTRFLVSLCGLKGLEWTETKEPQAFGPKGYGDLVVRLQVLYSGRSGVTDSQTFGATILMADMMTDQELGRARASAASQIWLEFSRWLSARFADGSLKEWADGSAIPWRPDERGYWREVKVRSANDIFHIGNLEQEVSRLQEEVKGLRHALAGYVNAPRSEDEEE